MSADLFLFLGSSNGCHKYERQHAPFFYCSDLGTLPYSKAFRILPLLRPRELTQKTHN
jgi:hypothetical protein